MIHILLLYPYIVRISKYTTGKMGLLPAQMLMGRQLQGRLPTPKRLLTPQTAVKVRKQLQERQECQKLYFDRQTRHLPELQGGDHVRVQRGETWQPAVVVHQQKNPRSYVIRTPDGRHYRRNRKHLRKTKEKPFGLARDPDVSMTGTQQTLT